MVTLVDGEAQLADGLTVLPTYGHTPGHQAVRIDGGDGHSAFFVGDALHQEQQVAQPGWCPIFDEDEEMAAATRRKLLTRIAEEEALLLSPHFAGFGIGRVEKGGKDGAEFS